MTWQEDVRPRLGGARTLAEAVAMLKDAAGSDDKLATALGTSRQTVIGWRKRGVFPTEYLERLRELGVPDELLRRATRAELERRLAAVESELKAIRDEL